MQSKHISIILVGVILAGACGFYGGNIYAKSKASEAPGQRLQAGAEGMRNFRANMGTAGQAGRATQGMAAGEVLSIDGQSISLKLRDGGSKLVFLTASTTVAKMDKAGLEDIASGTEITVNGTPNADGSLTAQVIQLRAEGMTGFGFGRQDQAPGAGGQVDR
jgi:hypothetical protein